MDDKSNNPKVFVSYSHDSLQHAASVLILADQLCADGIDCILDQYVDSPPEGWPRWMEEQLRAANFVLVICTATYNRRAMGKEEVGKGLGVRWESTLTYQHLYNAGTTNKRFIPILLDQADIVSIPTPLESSTHYFLPSEYEGLYRRLTGQQLTPKPVIGDLRKLPTPERPVAIPPAVSETSNNLRLQDTDKVLKRNKKLSTLASSKTIQPYLPINLPPQKKYELSEVFVKSGVPTVTFVEHDEFKSLKLALTEPGRGIVVEGPSGVGKTTALIKAVNQLKRDGRTGFVYLNARNSRHIRKILSLEEWHRGTVIIDDFHRIFKSHQEPLADYFKKLADIESKSSKLVIVGIPLTGQALVDTAFDVATRIDVFRMKDVKEQFIHRMIHAGEEALKINFEGERDIAKVANGSLNIAQFLCYYICSRALIWKTQDDLTKVQYNIDREVPYVMEVLKRKFDKTVKQFAMLDGFGDSTYFQLLKLLAKSEEGVLDLNDLKANRPDLSEKIEYFIKNELIKNLYRSIKNSKNFIFYEDFTQSLIIEDPQLIFYLKELQFSKLSKEIEKYIL